MKRWTPILLVALVLVAGGAASSPAMPDSLTPVAYNVDAGGDISPATFPHTIAQHYATAQLDKNSAAEKELYGDAIGDSLLVDAGMSLRAHYAGHFTAMFPGSDDRRVRLTIQQLGPPAVLFDSTALTPGTARDWSLDVFIIREAIGTDGRARAVWTDEPAGGGVASVRAITVEFSMVNGWFSPLTLSLRGTATGGANNAGDVTATLGFLEVLDKARP